MNSTSPVGHGGQARWFGVFAFGVLAAIVVMVHYAAPASPTLAYASPATRRAHGDTRTGAEAARPVAAQEACDRGDARECGVAGDAYEAQDAAEPSAADARELAMGAYHRGCSRGDTRSCTALNARLWADATAAW
jgi:hypothetical protein